MRKKFPLRSRAAAGAWSVVMLGALGAIILSLAPFPAPGPQTPIAGAAGAGFWHTSGSKILDSNGQTVRITEAPMPNQPPSR